MSVRDIESSDGNTRYAYLNKKTRKRSRKASR